MHNLLQENIEDKTFNIIYSEFYLNLTLKMRYYSENLSLKLNPSERNEMEEILSKPTIHSQTK